MGGTVLQLRGCSPLALAAPTALVGVPQGYRVRSPPSLLQAGAGGAAGAVVAHLCNIWAQLEAQLARGEAEQEERMRGGLGHSWEASGTAGAHVAHLGACGVQPEAHLWHIWGHDWMRPGTHLGNIWACAPHLAVTLLSRCWRLHGPRSALRCVRANKSPTTSGLVLLLLFFFSHDI